MRKLDRKYSHSVSDPKGKKHHVGNIKEYLPCYAALRGVGEGGEGGGGVDPVATILLLQSKQSIYGRCLVLKVVVFALQDAIEMLYPTIQGLYIDTAKLYLRGFSRHTGLQDQIVCK